MMTQDEHNRALIAAAGLLAGAGHHESCNAVLAAVTPIKPASAPSEVPCERCTDAQQCKAYSAGIAAARRSQKASAPSEGAPDGLIALAELFHDTYERLAPAYGYETRPDTKKFDAHSKNGRLMVATLRALRKYIAAPTAPSLPDEGKGAREDVRDAARYRLIRRGQHWSVIDGIGDTLRAESLDTAVDAVLALASSGKKGGSNAE